MKGDYAHRVFATSFFTTLLSFASVTWVRAALPHQAELDRADAWVNANFSASGSRAKLPPFSFLYGGKSSNEILRSWKIRVSPEIRRGRQIQRTYSYADPLTGLEVTCEVRRYEDFPAVEWVLYLTNTGRKPIPVLQDVRALDVRFRNRAGQFVLHRALGSSNEPTDFAPVEETLAKGERIYLAPVGGCASSKSALPFFNIELRAPVADRRRGELDAGDTLEGGGVMMAIGWTGQWSASFVSGDREIHIQAGMELTHLKLLPGERIRTPRILLLFWQGSDWLHAHNLLRSFILAYHAPRPGGQLPNLPIAAIPWFQFDNGNKATESNQIEFASLYLKKMVPIDTFWLDAGWFDGGWPDGVGNWFVKKDAFPRGLKPLADAVHKMGLHFLVWFEPERVAPGTWLDLRHPEWLLGEGKQKLLNLGNVEARRWLTGHISEMIEHEGLDIYRNDFSLDPLPYWRSADAQDRQGITEIRYIEGLYEYWDELIRRAPNLLIDNGASGGRRIDLETLSRSVPLWRFDYFGGKMPAFQESGVALGLYVPLSAAGVPPTPNNPRAEIPDLYIARSAMSAGLALAWDVRRPDFDDALARRIVKEQKRISKFYYGDLYPLTEVTARDNIWLAYQCDRPDRGEGMVMAFRREKASEATLTIEIRGLKTHGAYELEDVDRGTTRVASGRELAQGLRLNISTRPGSALLLYRLKK